MRGIREKQAPIGSVPLHPACPIRKRADRSIASVNIGKVFTRFTRTPVWRVHLVLTILLPILLPIPEIWSRNLPPVANRELLKILTKPMNRITNSGR